MTDSTKLGDSANRKELKNEATHAKGNGQVARVSLAALGVVFEDIATGPIYAIR